MKRWLNGKEQRAFLFFGIGILSFLFFLNGCFQKNQRQELSAKELLFISSFHDSHDWTKRVLESMQESFYRSPYTVTLRNVYLDSKNIPSFEKQAQILDAHLSSLQKEEVDAVVVSDLEAAIHMVNYMKSNKLSFPVVLVSEFDSLQFIASENLTLLIADIGVKATFDLGRTLFPQAKKVYIWADNTLTGQFYIEEAKRQLQPYADTFEISYGIKAETATELLAQASQLQANSFMILGTWQQGDNGMYYDPSVLYPRLVAAAHVPVLTLVDNVLDGGFLGGYVLSPEKNGKAAAEKVISLWDGAPNHSVSRIAPEAIFNQKELRTWQAERDLLPEDARLFNNWESFITENRGWLLGIVIGGGCLLLIILYLVRVKRQIQAKNRALDQALTELAKEKNRAQAADKSKSSFLANMSHEIRTPLNAIVGFSALLQAADSEVDRAEYAQIINQNNDQLLRLIGDILDLSRIESGTVDLKSERFDLSQTFEEIEKTIRQRNIPAGIRLICEHPYATCFVSLDRNRVIQVVMNFINNALKYTPQGEIVVGYHHKSNGVYLSVKDSGIGISQEKQQQLFNRFGKLDNYAPGTGLGLAICKAIVEASHGKIGCESKEGEGSTFWVWFPTEVECSYYKEIIASETNENLPQEEVPEDTVVRRSQNRLLVAEDVDSSYQLIRAILKQDTLSRAQNGLEAVEMAQAYQYDAVLMDFTMPLLDGLEATRRIRAIHPELPIIGVTSNAFERDRKNAFQMGCNAVIIKPFSKDELIRTLNEFIVG